MTHQFFIKEKFLTKKSTNLNTGFQNVNIWLKANKLTIILGNSLYDVSSNKN